MTALFVKTCVYCGREFTKRKRDSWAQWEARRVCSRECRPSLEDRLWSRVEKRAPDECWPWLGSVTSTGHGGIKIGAGAGRSDRGVHRVLFEAAHGLLPAGVDVHHTCENKTCCNVAHMVALSRGEHTRLTDGAAAHRERTHCVKGHPFDEENTRWRGNTRICRACARNAVEAYRQRKLNGAAPMRRGRPRGPLATKGT